MLYVVYMPADFNYRLIWACSGMSLSVSKDIGLMVAVAAETRCELRIGDANHVWCVTKHSVIKNYIH